MAIDIDAAIRQRLNQAGSEVVEMLRARLLEDDHLATGELYNSITYEVVGDNGEMTINIYALPYFQYVDQGRPPGKQPPIENIQSWVSTRGIHPRSTSIPQRSQGLDRTDRSLAFLIARKIGLEGIKPANIMEPTLESVQDDLAGDIHGIITAAITEIIGDNLKDIAAAVNNDVLTMTINYLN